MILDSGHGGKQVGAVYDGVAEKDINLTVAMQTGERLTKLGYRVGYTRTIDETLGPSERVARANGRYADVFVSLHCNAATDGAPGPGGIETLYYANSMRGAALAKAVQASLIAATNARNRLVKARDNIYVLQHTRMPAVLVEMGFLSNPGERAKLKDPAYQQIVAGAIAAGIDKHMRGDI